MSDEGPTMPREQREAIARRVRDMGSEVLPDEVPDILSGALAKLRKALPEMPEGDDEARAWLFHKLGGRKGVRRLANEGRGEGKPCCDAPVLVEATRLGTARWTKVLWYCSACGFRGSTDEGEWDDRLR